ncbi:hypothetical protein [Zoogloea sp.]|uniref:hypothetical protein n=1 Tax=Zoogloea sp. TaxID=49181 RepID=UPI0035B4AE4E
MKTKLMLLALACLPFFAQAGEGQVLEARTAAGEAVRLLPNGRWEFVDAARQAEAKKVADTYPENDMRPAKAQGGVLGIGRLIMPGDPDYNRGSLSGKGR